MFYTAGEAYKDWHKTLVIASDAAAEPICNMQREKLLPTISIVLYSTINPEKLHY